MPSPDAASVLTVSAPAKVNLGLEVVGRRPDGYHDLVTILQTIELADRLRFELASELTLASDHGALASSDNLVWRAAQALRSEAGLREGARITLEKKIPVAAGLGGGSSDAAATLVALNQLWGLDWDQGRLQAIARQLGADVAFFVRGGTQLATGRGDELTPLPTPALWLVIAPLSAPCRDKTQRLYRALSPSDWSDGGRVLELARALPDPAGLIGRPLPSSFERVTRQLVPAVATIGAAIERIGAVASLCGAGPSILSVHGTVADAIDLADRLRSNGIDALVSRATAPSGQPAAGMAPTNAGQTSGA